ncbi:DUF2252 family protein [Halobacillus naozhouensis]|uniref:DUF2252 family protein n=1 Tax=Halobacillus naozhouensis TaxID=554880 RepID=A0ABY8ISW0_9BACI|nr:DUF2252 family protein [Halobacillus naozhouensis]WFT73020.1 DUF2252 family protein [Halobacillus naozhouensis]
MSIDIRNEIMETKRYLRKQLLATIFNQFDGKLMGLSHEDRVKKYKKMSKDPYSFFRGSAYLFYYDVTGLPFTFHTPEDKPTWLLGDLHFDNISAFLNEKGDVVFDVDDFDEGYFGSYLYDVLRLVVSIRLMSSQHGYTGDDTDDFVKSFLNDYIGQLQRFHSGEEDPVYLQFTKANTTGPIQNVLHDLEGEWTSSGLESPTSQFDSIQSVLDDGNLVDLSHQEKEEFLRVWEDYIESIPVSIKKHSQVYSVKDVMKKAGAGIGSTGLMRYYIMIAGEGNKNIILEAKEARTPIPAYFFPYDETFWKDHQHQGRRVVHTQQAMHHKADPYLGYMTINGHDFYVRERSPFTNELNTDDLQELDSMLETVKTMAKITAKIHARADVDIEDGLMNHHSEEAILHEIESNRNEFIQQLTLWSAYYQKVVESDFHLFNEWRSENPEITEQN